MRPLVVLVPGHHGRAKALRPLRELLASQPAFAKAAWIEFDYRRPLPSNESPETIAQNLSDTIDGYLHANKGDVSGVILAGHSLGTALIRRAFLNASGFGRSKVLTRAWPKAVDRIVLMGGFGRGFDPRWQPLLLRLPLVFVIALSRLLGLAKLRRSILKGSDFMSRLRVDWITYCSSMEVLPKVVHLLGSKDLAARPVDAIDIDQFPNAIPVGVPNVGHTGIATPGPDTSLPLLRAFVDEPKSNRAVEFDRSADEVFFLLHGIRDSRKCFEAVAQELARRRPGAKIIVPTYGYLSARSFLIPVRRNSYIPWFVDEFAERLARNPSATFYFAGHSNGTYIFGEVLDRVPRAVFDRVYLAASVLPQRYDWGTVIDTRNQVDSVRCDMGSEDWPVGVGCSVLQRLGMKRIGSGGFDGFEYGDLDHVSYNVFPGGHGDMLKKGNVESIAEFLMTGAPTEVSRQTTAPPSSAFRFLRKYGDVVLPSALAGGLALAAYGLGPVFTMVVLILVWIIAGRF